MSFDHYGACSGSLDLSMTTSVGLLIARHASRQRRVENVSTTGGRLTACLERMTTDTARLLTSTLPQDTCRRLLTLMDGKSIASPIRWVISLMTLTVNSASTSEEVRLSNRASGVLSTTRMGSS